MSSSNIIPMDIDGLTANDFIQLRPSRKVKNLFSILAKQQGPWSFGLGLKGIIKSPLRDKKQYLLRMCVFKSAELIDSYSVRIDVMPLNSDTKTYNFKDMTLDDIKGLVAGWGYQPLHLGSEIDMPAIVRKFFLILNRIFTDDTKITTMLHVGGADHAKYTAADDRIVPIILKWKSS